MSGGNYAALIISASALVISIYGVVERRRDARRNEWLRLTGTIADLDALYYEQTKSPDGPGARDRTDAINSRREVLSSHALALLPRFEKEITSSELRVLAYALSRAGYSSQAEQIWTRAVTRATAEGATQTLFARRGYAYFLFSIGRTDDARTQMRQAVNSATQDDTSRLKAVETLKFWAAEDKGAEGLADALLAEAQELADQIQTPRIQAQASKALQPDTQASKADTTTQ